MGRCTWDRYHTQELALEYEQYISKLQLHKERVAREIGRNRDEYTKNFCVSSHL